MGMMQQLMHQNNLLQQQLNLQSTTTSNRFSLDSEFYNSSWTYEVKWEPKKTTFKDWLRDFGTELKTVRPGCFYF